MERPQGCRFRNGSIKNGKQGITWRWQWSLKLVVMTRTFWGLYRFIRNWMYEKTTFKPRNQNERYHVDSCSGSRISLAGSLHSVPREDHHPGGGPKEQSWGWVVLQGGHGQGFALEPESSHQTRDYYFCICSICDIWCFVFTIHICYRHEKFSIYTRYTEHGMKLGSSNCIFFCLLWSSPHP